jgi:hypothetical protein
MPAAIGGRLQLLAAAVATREHLGRAAQGAGVFLLEPVTRPMSSTLF